MRPQAHAWEGLTSISAIGGVVLFASAGFFVLVMVGTHAGRASREQAPIQWAESLGTPSEGYCLDGVGPAGVVVRSGRGAGA